MNPKAGGQIRLSPPIAKLRDIRNGLFVGVDSAEYDRLAGVDRQVVENGLEQITRGVRITKAIPVERNLVGAEIG